MREIKFRCWHKDYREMYHVSKLSLRYSYVQCSSGGHSSHTFSTKIVELMQYTGIKDKNGEEIYEGDIIVIVVHPKVTSLPVEVKWLDEMCSFNIPPGVRYWKIIGNIYEVPESFITGDN